MAKASVQNQATHSIPAELSVPTEVLALPEVFSLVEKANLPAVAVALQFTDLFDEVQILDRLAYKNKNQHRASKHHQAVSQVLKVLHLLQQLHLPALMQALHTAAERTALPEAPATTGSSKRVKCQQQPKQSAAAQRQAVRLPSFQAGCFVLRRLLSGAQLLLDLHYVILTAGQHLSGQLSRGYFMPFCLVAAATVSRIRVLATTALLELLQAYNGLVQLLPLLPMITPGGVASSSSSSCTKGSSSRFGMLSLGGEGLPQMLQLAWNGPIPALRSIPFDDQGRQSLQGLAAELQQTYLISSSNGNHADVLGVSGVPRAMQQDVLQDALAGVSSVQQGAGGVAGDVGVAISREAFAQQLGQQQHQAAARERPQRRNKQQKQQQQQQQQPAAAISFFEDKQPERRAAGAEAPGADAEMQQAPAAAAAAVPLYTSVPGLGFSLGDTHQAGPTLPVLLEQTAPTAAAGALGLPGQVAAQPGGVGGPQAPGGRQLPAAAAAAACAAGVQKMNIDTAEDGEEFAQLYGRQPTPTQKAPLVQQPQAQAQQQQLGCQPGTSVSTLGPSAAAGAGAGLRAGVRRGLQAPAAFLAMQGSHSSDDDEEMQPTTVGVVTAAAAAGAPTRVAAVQGQSETQPALLIPQQALWQQQRLQQQQQQPSTAPAAPVPGPSVGMPAQTGSTAGTGAVVPGSQAVQAEQPAPLLQVSRKIRIKKKGQPKAALGGKDAAAGGDEAPRDSILDLLLQGL